MAEPKTCLCGCGQTPKGRNSEFALGHTPGYAMDLFRRVRVGDGEAARELVERGWVDWYEKLKADGALPRLKIDPTNPRSWPVLEPLPEYTDEQKMEALRLAFRTGSTLRASQETGIPNREILRWVALWNRLHRHTKVDASADVEFLRISRERGRAQRDAETP